MGFGGMNLGRGFGHMGSPLGGATATLPLVLSGISNVYAAYGTVRLVSGYNGPLFRVFRTSDSATLDVSALASNRPDMSGVSAFLSGAVGRIDKVYDQSGNGLDLTQTTATKRPKLKENVFGTLPAICFDQIDPVALVDKCLVFPTISLSRASMGAVFIGEETRTQTSGPELDLRNATNNELWIGTRALGSNSGASKPFTRQSTTNLVPSSNAVMAKSSKCIRGTSINGTSTNNVTFYQDGNSSTANSTTDTTLVSGQWGARSDSSNALGTAITANRLGMVLFNAPFSAGDFTTMSARAKVICSLPQIDAPLVTLSGDSITDGFGSSQVNHWSLLLQSQISTTFRMDNVGWSGSTLTTWDATAVANLITTRYSASHKCILVHLLCTNDIATNSAADGAALAATYLAFLAARKAEGWLVGACTLLPRSGSFSGGQTKAGFQTQRAAFNSAVSAGTSNYTFLVDYAANATIGPDAASDNTTYFSDGVHPTLTVQTIMAQIAGAAIGAQLP